MKIQPAFTHLHVIAKPVGLYLFCEQKIFTNAAVPFFLAMVVMVCNVI